MFDLKTIEKLNEKKVKELKEKGGNYEKNRSYEK